MIVPVVQSPCQFDIMGRQEPMDKKLVIVLSFLLVIIFFGTQRVAAANPTPTPTPAPVPQGAAAKGGVYNDLVPLGKDVSGDTLPQSRVDVTSGASTDTKTWSVPAFDLQRSAMLGPATSLLPIDALTRVKDAENVLYISGTTAIYVHIGNITLPVLPFIRNYKTDLLPVYKDLDQYLRQSQFLGGSALKPNDEGIYDMRRKALDLQEIPEETEDVGKENKNEGKPVAQSYEQESYFGTILRSLLSVLRINLASKQLLPYAGDVFDKSKAMADNYAPIDHDTTKGQELNGDQQNEVVSGKTSTTRTEKTNGTVNTINYAICSVLPMGKDVQFGVDCTGYVTPPCDGEMPDLKTSPNCKLKNNTLHLPANLIKAIEAAATVFKVPPSLAVGVFYGEGAFNPGSIFLDESQVEKYLKGCTKLPNCSSSASVYNNIAPIMKQYWPQISTAVNEIAPDRKPDPCNLLDGIFAIVKDLSQNQTGSAAFAGKTCFGIPLNGPGGRESSCTWSDKNAETAIRIWEFGVNWNDTTMSCATKLNSCLMGGGLDAQCETGGDTCETVGTRYPQKSHNGCVWDVYKAN